MHTPHASSTNVSHSNPWPQFPQFSSLLYPHDSPSCFKVVGTVYDDAKQAKQEYCISKRVKIRFYNVTIKIEYRYLDNWAAKRSWRMFDRPLGKVLFRRPTLCTALRIHNLKI